MTEQAQKQRRSAQPDPLLDWLANYVRLDRVFLESCNVSREKETGGLSRFELVMYPLPDSKEDGA